MRHSCGIGQSQACHAPNLRYDRAQSQWSCLSTLWRGVFQSFAAGVAFANVSPICREYYSRLPDVQRKQEGLLPEFRDTYTRRGRKRRVDGIPVSEMVVPIAPIHSTGLPVLLPTFVYALALFHSRVLASGVACGLPMGTGDKTREEL
eukprot:3763663-Amphidinium_carterae.1